MKIFTNGTIYINAKETVQNLLVGENGAVVAHNVQIKDYPAAEYIDLQQFTVYPGFIDSHCHVLECGFFLNAGINLSGCYNADDISKKIAEKIDGYADHDILLGLGYKLQNYDGWSLADLQKIDQVTKGRPCVLVDYTGHNTIINTAAIELVGLDAATFQVPMGGKFGVENGKLTGMFRESAMREPVDDMINRIHGGVIKEGAYIMLKKWAEMGYTGIVDLMGAPGFRILRPEVFQALEQEDRLPLRVNYCYTLFTLDEVDIAASLKGKDTDLVRYNGGKIFIDGAFAGGEAWTSWAHKNDGGYGLQQVQTDDSKGEQYNINRIVARAETLGLNMHYHTQGDRAIETVVVALEKVIAEIGQLKCIHTLAHVGFVRDDLLVRMKALGEHLILTVQPAFWELEAGADFYYGERFKESYALRKMIDCGLNLAVSTDFNVSPLPYAPPSMIMKVACTGGGHPEYFTPMIINEVIDGLGRGSAMVTGRGDTGTLCVGRKADMVVYAQDLNDLDPSTFADHPPQVVSTYINGEKQV